MKKFLSFFTTILFGFIFLFTAVKVSAQEFDFKKAYEDYQFTLETYNNSFTAYKDAKDAYQKNSTLTLKEEARKKTWEMLTGRDELEKVYLTMLRMKIRENAGLTNDEKGALFTKIDSEVDWYLKHKEQYKSDDPLEDLFNKSSESESRYKTDTSPIIYEALFYVSKGDLTHLRTRHETVYSVLKKTIEDGAASGKLKVDPFNRWFTDIENVDSELKKSDDLALTKIQKLYTESYSSPEGTYESAIEILTGSVKMTSQLNSFLIEVLTSIVNQL